METKNRDAYRSVSLLAHGRELSNDTWQTGLNCNQLVIGPSGCGKTRSFLRPNLLQANASYLVLDTKGQLCRELGPSLRAAGYDVRSIDFCRMEGSVGYDPLDHIEWDEDGCYSEQDVLSVATAICPVESAREPFWDHAAANLLACLIAYVVEAFPCRAQSMDRVVEILERANLGNFDNMFEGLTGASAEGCAVRYWRRLRSTMGADKMWASLLGIISEKVRCLSFAEARRLFRAEKRVDFESMGHGKVALFACVSDVDFSCKPLTDLFVTQALQALVREADRCPGGRLPVPVRLFLDDFSNLSIPNFDKVISVTRSREIWCTMLLQSVSQLQAVYGPAGAETIMANCDAQLVMGFADDTTASAFSSVARRTCDTLRGTPLDECWLFVRGRQPERVRKCDPDEGRAPARTEPVCEARANPAYELSRGIEA